MAVHKKHPADVKISTDVAMAEKEVKPVETKSDEIKIEEPGKAGELKEEVAVPDFTDESADIPSSDPLSDFKERMIKEESSSYGNAPKKNYMWPILLVFIIAILLLAGVFLYKSQSNTNNTVNIVTLSPTPTIAPEPTKTVDAAQYEIEIQNGSGVTGEASRQETNLEAEGFTVSSIGNADNSDYIDTIIQAKEEVDKDFIAKLKSVLSNSFTVGEIEVLPDDSSVPVVVILGTKK